MNEQDPPDYAQAAVPRVHRTMIVLDHRAHGDADGPALVAAEKPVYKPTNAAVAERSRCCGGRADLLNPHACGRHRDQDGSRGIYEPLAG
jgi:hypothetical protein